MSNPFNAKFKGWVNKSNVTLVIAAIFLFFIPIIVIKSVWPIAPLIAEYVLYGWAVSIFIFVGFACYMAHKNSPADNLSVSDGNFNLQLQNPTQTNILIVVQLVQRLLQARPAGIIPEELSADDNPDKFKKLTDEESQNMLVEEALKAVQPINQDANKN